ncbi:protein of unknown function [Azospirillum baldaniorum]|uniref:Uncharacterized protein n=1 Tax=Azospirillum baldaniorum TaxID=1064539 RepID=A0A9P1JNL6_9PROT|nr:protein of unknown function [Azospirillum baldaniorum]
MLLIFLSQFRLSPEHLKNCSSAPRVKRLQVFDSLGILGLRMLIVTEIKPLPSNTKLCSE